MICFSPVAAFCWKLSAERLNINFNWQFVTPTPPLARSGLNSGLNSKSLHPGKAACNGILSADLARQGFTGATRILEGERGFFRATTTSYDASRITDALGSRWKIPENCYKMHSCCGHTHTAIDVALEHRTACGWRGAEALDRLERVEVATYAQGYEIVKQQNPATPYQAKFSLAYCVAAALLDVLVRTGESRESSRDRLPNVCASEKSAAANFCPLSPAIGWMD